MCPNSLRNENLADVTVKSMIQAQLPRHGCWQSLFELDDLDWKYDPEGKVPFHGRKVHYDNEWFPGQVAS